MVDVYFNVKLTVFLLELITVLCQLLCLLLLISSYLGFMVRYFHYYHITVSCSQEKIKLRSWLCKESCVLGENSVKRHLSAHQQVSAQDENSAKPLGGLPFGSLHITK